jgi:tRNA (guanine-N7-)-methyltransferase
VTQGTDPQLGVLRPGVRTYKPRRGRITARQRTALHEQASWLLTESDSPLVPSATWGPGTPVVLEIGFGTGEATAQMASADPDTGILAIDVHTPGVGNLLDLITRRELGNVRVMETDAVRVLRTLIEPESLAGVRSYFPDPWMKARHHKRRLVQPAIVDLVHSRLAPGGYWHLATDWAEYAERIQHLFGADGGWSGGLIERPAWRPETLYERRALRDGRHIVDLLFHRTPD